MPYVTSLRCRECGREYPVEPLYVCDFCFGPLEVQYDYEAIGKVMTRERIQAGPPTMWRYEDLLPVDGSNAVDIGVGFTPLLKAENLGRQLGLNNLWIKNDAVNPTYSFKDRVVAVASTKAREFGFDTLACASTGNLAGAVAAHGAKAGFKTLVFIPADLEAGKVIGAAVYGPTVVAVKGSYDDVNRLCSELADTRGWAFVNINMRTYYSEGSKTLAYEVAEQLNWRAPAHMVIPVASGSLYTKVWKGLHELDRLNLIDGVPTKMHIAQPEGCAPVVEAFKEGQTHHRIVEPKTIAKSLAIGNPADGFYDLQVARQSGGQAVAVPEPEVTEGIMLLARTEGIFTETAGGVTVSALRNLAVAGAIGPDDPVVALITGNGLKTQEVVADHVKPVTIEPTVESFEHVLGNDS